MCRLYRHKSMGGFLRLSIKLRRLWALAGTVVLCGTPLRAQDQEKFVPIPPALVQKYHFNFPRNFFPSPAAEKADRKKVDAVLSAVEKYKGKVTASAENLYKSLELSDEAQAQSARHAI